jgi:hypothetical protein
MKCSLDDRYHQTRCHEWSGPHRYEGRTCSQSIRDVAVRRLGKAFQHASPEIPQVTEASRFSEVVSRNMTPHLCRHVR